LSCACSCATTCASSSGVMPRSVSDRERGRTFTSGSQNRWSTGSQNRWSTGSQSRWSTLRSRTAQRRPRRSPSRAPDRESRPSTLSSRDAEGEVDDKRGHADDDGESGLALARAVCKRVLKPRGLRPRPRDDRRCSSPLGDVIAELERTLIDGSYRAGDIRRVWIPKSGGGQRVTRGCCPTPSGTSAGRWRDGACRCDRLTWCDSRPAYRRVPACSLR